MISLSQQAKNAHMNANSVLKTHQHYELPQCSICMEDLIKELAVAKCGHVFHFTWYYINNK